MNSRTETERFGYLSNTLLAKATAVSAFIGAGAAYAELFDYLATDAAIIILLASSALGGLLALHALAMGWIPDE